MKSISSHSQFYSYSVESTKKSRKERTTRKTTAPSTPVKKKKIKTSPEKQQSNSTSNMAIEVLATTDKSILSPKKSQKKSIPAAPAAATTDVLPANPAVVIVKEENSIVKMEIDASQPVLVPLHPRVQTLMETLEKEAKKGTSFSERKFNSN